VGGAKPAGANFRDARGDLASLAAPVAAPLYLSDLDGTLLNRAGQLSRQTRFILTELLLEGMVFSVATARSHVSVRSLLGDLPVALPIIAFNGALLTDYATGRHLEVSDLGTPLAEAVFSQVLAAGLRPFVSSYDGERDHLYFDDLGSPAMASYVEGRQKAGDPRLTRTSDLRASLREQVLSLTVMSADEQRVLELEQGLASHFGPELRLYRYENAYAKGSYWLTIHHKNASKHTAMKRLVEHLSHAGQVVAFGDHYNDLEMIEHADVGVAMGNAVPELKELADHVIGHHAENAVALFLADHFRREAALHSPAPRGIK
jgi:5-amino-6-(5-phospho-D-ribitylamino)uracil phosphatase